LCKQTISRTRFVSWVFGDARARIAEALAEYDPNDYLSHRAVSGLNPQTFCLGVAGWNEWFLDYPDRALQAALEGVAMARGQGYPQSVDQAIHTAAHTHLLRREPEATQSYLDSALAILASTGFLQRIAQLRLMRGSAWHLRRTIGVRSLSSRKDWPDIAQTEPARGGPIFSR